MYFFDSQCIIVLLLLSFVVIIVPFTNAYSDMSDFVVIAINHFFRGFNADRRSTEVSAAIWLNTFELFRLTDDKVLSDAIFADCQEK